MKSNKISKRISFHFSLPLGLILGTLVIVFYSLIAAASGSSPVLGDPQWMSITFQGRKIGYRSYTVVPDDVGYSFSERIFMRMSILDRPQTLLLRTTCMVNDDFSLRSFRFLMDADPTTMEVEGTLTDDGLHVRYLTPNGERESTFPVTGKIVLPICLPALIAAHGLETGKTISLNTFDYLTQRQDTIHVDILGTEEIATPLFKGSVFQVRVEYHGLTSKVWIDTDGVIHRDEGFPGMIFTSDTPLGARSGLSENSPLIDIAHATSVRIDRPVVDPRERTLLQMHLSGIDVSKFDLAGGRQTLFGQLLEIIKEDLTQVEEYQLPYRGPLHAEYLRESYFIQSNHPEIRQKAYEIVGKTLIPSEAARRVLNWMHDNVEKTPLLSVPNALDVLREKSGDCNEHAVLAAALLRAVGIPVRICTGLVYGDEQFSYHAWNEIFLGQWVSFDAALNQFPADVTHIRLIRGDLDQQMRLLSTVGSIHIEIVDSP